MTAPQLVFAEELDRFRARTGTRQYDGLVLLGTGQPTTAALLLGTLAVPRVAFLLTKDTRQMPQQVADLLGRDLATTGWEMPEGDHEPIAKVYKGLLGIIQRWDVPRDQIAVDVTGGTKPMSLGLDKAAYVLGLTTIYIQSDYVDVGGRRQFTPGTQRIEISPDPYVVFGDLEAAEAERLWQAHDYAGAQQIFAKLAQRVAPADRAQHAALATLAAAYHCWNEFALADAHHALAELLAAPLPDVLVTHHAALSTQATMLGRLQATVADASGKHHAAALRALADEQRMRDLLGTLHCAALRNVARGDYDTAALLRYRCLELISQHRLATWEILAESPDFTRALRVVPDLDARYRSVEAEIFGTRNLRGLPYAGRNGRIPPLALFGSYMLLAALADPLVVGYPISRIRDRSEARNKSILAHGYRLIDQPIYAEFATIVDELLDRLLAIHHVPRDSWERESTFVLPQLRNQPPS